MSESARFDVLLAAASDRLASGGRLLLWGPNGAGKTTLATLLARRLAARGVVCRGIAADPGSPGFGVPGALALGTWAEDGWRVDRLAALCTLDAARFRLPLVQALRRLAEAAAGGALLIDAPGVVRGTAGAELLQAMVEAVRADVVAALVPDSGAEGAAAGSALASLGVRVLRSAPSPGAHHRTKAERARSRTQAWDAWLGSASRQRIGLDGLRLAGTPPRLAPRWRGRLVALLDGAGESVAMGEVADLDDGVLVVRLVAATGADAGQPATLLVRDAARLPGGLVGTLRRPVPAPAAAPGLPPELAPPQGEGADPARFVHLGSASALLVGGLFSDPLLHLRLRQRPRSLFFDLGDAGRLPARIAHQVTDVFLSHAHMDHIAGFPWFLRSRMGVTTPCRMFGPPGLLGHLEGFVAGVRWDRLGPDGPRFEVTEIHGDRLHRFRLRVGGAPERAGETEAAGGLVLSEAGFSVRAVTLDHGIPVLAWRLDIAATLHMRPERLESAGLREGHWVGELKRRVLAGEEDALVTLPDGTTAPAGELARRFAERRPAQGLVYATDLADSPDNRARLIALAMGADVLICEAGFIDADAAQAQRTGHLTARACGAIARAAGVARLVPFHFSRRYEDDPSRVYDEVEAGLGAPVARVRRTPGDPPGSR